MTFLRQLAAVLGLPGFRRLFAVRLVSQLADGVFQAALASSILFSPERAPDAPSIAVAFAVVLLPFTALGPFVGVVLDRWPRRRTIVLSNAVRVALLGVVAADVARGDGGPLFYVLVLLAFSVNRFLLAGLSAGLPLVAPPGLLVVANSVGPTCGSMTYLVGLGLGGLVRGLGGSDAAILLAGAASYGLAALLALRLPFLGPALGDAGDEVREALRHVVAGLVDAVRNLPGLARLGLGVAWAVRVPYAVMIVATVLLYRRHFAGGGTGFEGVGIAVGAAGLGFGLAAVLTPVLEPRLGARRYVAAASLVGAVALLLPAAVLTPWSVTVTSFATGVATQAVKITIDTTVQRVVPDVYRGRLFTLYDVLFNVALILGVVLAALVLPPDGASVPVLLGAAAWYAALAAVVLRRWRSRDELVVTLP